eukprot:g7771.t1
MLGMQCWIAYDLYADGRYTFFGLLHEARPQRKIMHDEFLATIALMLVSVTHTLTNYSLQWHLRAAVKSVRHHFTVLLYVFCDVFLHTVVLAAFLDTLMPRSDLCGMVSVVRDNYKSVKGLAKVLVATVLTYGGLFLQWMVVNYLLGHTLYSGYTTYSALVIAFLVTPGIMLALPPGMPKDRKQWLELAKNLLVGCLQLKVLVKAIGVLKAGTDTAVVAAAQAHKKRVDAHLLLEKAQKSAQAYLQLTEAKGSELYGAFLQITLLILIVARSYDDITQNGTTNDTVVLFGVTVAVLSVSVAFTVISFSVERHERLLHATLASAKRKKKAKDPKKNKDVRRLRQQRKFLQRKVKKFQKILETTQLEWRKDDEPDKLRDMETVAAEASRVALVFKRACEKGIVLMVGKVHQAEGILETFRSAAAGGESESDEEAAAGTVGQTAEATVRDYNAAGQGELIDSGSESDAPLAEDSEVRAAASGGAEPLQDAGSGSDGEDDAQAAHESVFYTVQVCRASFKELKTIESAYADWNLLCKQFIEDEKNFSTAEEQMIKCKMQGGVVEAVNKALTNVCTFLVSELLQHSAAGS